MRKIVFEPNAFTQYADWAVADKDLFRKITKLVEEISRHPFEGSGKPEALKHKLKGYWSRRINQEHRIVYKVTDDSIIVFSCRFHY